MKVMVTGASGFIGCILVKRLIAEGHEVLVLGQANNPQEESRLAGLAALNAQITPVSLFDDVKLREALRGCARVYHLAAAQHEANVGEDHFRKVNVEGVRNLLEQCIAAGVERVVHGSTIGVYGDAGAATLDENSATSPMNMYGRTKLEGERLALSYADRIFVTAIRISETYGPGDGRLLKLFRAIQKGSFLMIGPGKNKRQLIHVNDLTRALMLAGEVESARGEVFVIAGNEVLTTNETAQTIAAALGRKTRAWGLPLWPFMVLAWLMEQTLGRVGIQPPLHRRRLDFFRKSFVFDTGKAETVLGFKPEIPFSTGAAETATWYREQGSL